MAEPRLIPRLRLLIVDVDASSHAELAASLGKLDRHAEFARDGADALARYQAALASGAAFDAVLMDLTVPGGMGGREAIQHLLELDPNARAIASSGCLGTTVTSDCGLPGFRAFLAKPYSLQELSRALSTACG